MAAAGLLRLQGTITGFLGGPRLLDIAWDLTASPPYHVAFNLGDGSVQVFTAPDTARFAALIPPKTNAVTWYLSFDGGAFQQLDLVLPFVLTFGEATPHTFYLKCVGGNITGGEIWAA